MANTTVTSDGRVQQPAGSTQTFIGPSGKVITAVGSTPPPTPSGRRRPVIIACG